MELRGKGRDDQVGRIGDEPRGPDDSERQEQKTSEAPAVESELVVVRPPGDERPLTELLADPELRLAWQEASERGGGDESGSPGDRPDEGHHVWLIMAELEKEGHAPQRHEGQVTRRQLIDRVMLGHDPAQTGPDKQIDVVTGKKHPPPNAATKFETPAAMVCAYEAVHASDNFERQRNLADTDNARSFRVELSLDKAIGPNYGQMVSGVDRDTTSTTGWREHQFGEDSLVLAVFRRINPQSQWRLVTIYPV